MKTFNLLLVVVGALALGAFAFMPQAETLAVAPEPEAPKGTVHTGCTSTDCQSGFEKADCSVGGCKLMNGYNLVNVAAGPWTAFAQTLESVPAGPAGLKLQPKPVQVYFNDENVIPLVQVCFPKGNGSGQVFKHTNAGWLPLATTFANGLACGTSWGGGTFGYFK
jgi:hypothetical protein